MAGQESTDVKHLDAKGAWQLMQDDARTLLVDIRSTMEFLFVGHPKGAVHIPWIDEPDWTVNPHFVTRVRELMLGGGISQGDSGSVPVVLICRSGKRSLEAGKLLLEEGIPGVYHVSDGFEGDLDDNHQRSTLAGWRFEGLPWEQC